jgi:hypothetical protein
VEQLVHLGFTDLEARVYLSLVSEGAATGYRVAERVGKPIANVYKALESLRRKGAVNEEAKLHAAVDPSALLGRIEAGFSARCREASDALRALPRSKDEGIANRLVTVEQVTAEARSMIQSAEEIVLVDAFPRPLEALRHELTAAAREKTVGVQAYAPFELARAAVVVATEGPDLVARWPGHWLNVIADGRRALLAFLDPSFEAVHHALVVTSLPLAVLLHSGFSAEMRLNAFAPELASARGARALQKRIAEASAIPGARELLGVAPARARAADVLQAGRAWRSKRRSARPTSSA